MLTNFLKTLLYYKSDNDENRRVGFLSLEQLDLLRNFYLLDYDVPLEDDRRQAFEQSFLVVDRRNENSFRKYDETADLVEFNIPDVDKVELDLRLLRLRNNEGDLEFLPQYFIKALSEKITALTGVEYTNIDIIELDDDTFKILESETTFTNEQREVVQNSLMFKSINKLVNDVMNPFYVRLQPILASLGINELKTVFETQGEFISGELINLDFNPISEKLGLPDFLTDNLDVDVEPIYFANQNDDRYDIRLLDFENQLIDLDDFGFDNFNTELSKEIYSALTAGYPNLNFP